MSPTLAGKFYVASSPADWSSRIFLARSSPEFFPLEPLWDFAMTEILPLGALDAISLEGAPILAPTTETHGGVLRALSRPLPEATARHGYVLHYGNAQSALVWVVPDDHWPGMWRMTWPDGRLSDMGNLLRIRDAAAAICERGPPARNRRRFHWKIDQIFSNRDCRRDH
jgi:hypothetical protein